MLPRIKGCVQRWLTRGQASELMHPFRRELHCKDIHDTSLCMLVNEGLFEAEGMK